MGFNEEGKGVWGNYRWRKPSVGEGAGSEMQSANSRVDLIFKRSGNHGPIKTAGAIGGGRIKERKHGIGAGKIGKRRPA